MLSALFVRCILMHAMSRGNDDEIVDVWVVGYAHAHVHVQYACGSEVDFDDGRRSWSCHVRVVSNDASGLT